MSGFEAVVGLEKLTIHQCQNLAKDIGFDGATFDLCGPKGKKPAKWLDAYMGLFQIVGHEGFMMVRDIEFSNLWCENLMPKAIPGDAAPQGSAKENK